MPLRVIQIDEKITPFNVQHNLFFIATHCKQNKNCQHKNTLSYELSSVTTSSFHRTEELWESKKDKLLHGLEVERHYLPMIGYDSNSLTILEFMAENKEECTMHENKEIFGPQLQSLNSSVIPPFQESSITALVLGRYDIEPSIKGVEQSRRQRSTVSEIDVRNLKEKTAKYLISSLGSQKNKANFEPLIFRMECKTIKSFRWLIVMKQLIKQPITHWSDLNALLIIWRMRIKWSL